MGGHDKPRWMRLLACMAWTIVLALLPWWMGLPLWLLLGVGAVTLHHRIDHYAGLCRHGLRWGLPGLLFAAQRALGGDALAWGVALLGALAGYSLIALMESLLERWEYREQESLALHARDRSSIYGGFHLYVLRG